MPPRDFSQDGAAGAGGVNTSTNSPGSVVPAPPAAGGDWSGSLGSPSYGTDPSNTAAYEQASKQKPSSVGGGFSMNPDNLGAYRQAYSAAGLSFEDGGDVPDDGSGGDSNGSPQQDAIQKALSTVDGVLAFGRQLHGLGGDNQGAGISGASSDADDGRGMPASWNQPGQGHDYSGFNQSSNVEDRRSETSPAPAGSEPRRTKFDDVVDRVKDFGAGYNQMSQAAGINDIGSNSSGGAINTEENQ